jgi:hypothetical protein
VDKEAAYTLPGVLQVVQDGGFLGVVAEREEQAVQAAQALRKTAQWQIEQALPDQHALYEHLLHAPAHSLLVVDGAPVEAPIPPVETPPNTAQTLTATYYRPYHMHASLGPSAAIAQMAGTRLTLWTHSQGVYPLRGALAQVLDMDDEEIHLIHVEGPGCYGHNGADDVTLDAALAPPLAVPCCCNGCARMSTPGSLMGRQLWSTCRPASMPGARSLPGAMMCAVTPIPGARDRWRAFQISWRPGNWQRRWNDHRRVQAAAIMAASTATPTRSTISPNAALSRT